MGTDPETMRSLIQSGAYRPSEVAQGSPFVHVADLVGPDGLTYRERNAQTFHSFEVGELVEIEDGVRLFVTSHHRDCDATPLYGLGMLEEDGSFRELVHGWTAEPMRRVSCQTDRVSELERALLIGQNLTGALDPTCWCRDLTAGVCPACQFRTALAELLPKGGDNG